MAKMSFLLSLPTDNDYQRERAAATKETAQRLGVALEVAYADNDAIKQSEVVQAIQRPAEKRPKLPWEPY
jgi:hypothetical protein